MNTTLRTNIKLLISTLRSASHTIGDEAVREIEKADRKKLPETTSENGENR